MKISYVVVEIEVLGELKGIKEKDKANRRNYAKTNFATLKSF